MTLSKSDVSAWGILNWPHLLLISGSEIIAKPYWLLVDMALKDLEKVLYFENFVVIEPGLTSLEKGQLLSEEILRRAGRIWR